MKSFEEQLVTSLYSVRVWIAPAKTRYLPVDLTGEGVAERISSSLRAERPCMIGRFGATELAGMMCVRDIELPLPLFVKYWRIFRGEMRAAGRWSPRIRRHMAEWSGFFPLTDEALARFVARMEQDAGELDVLGSWLAEETRVRHLFPNAVIVPVKDLRPEQHDPPWSRVLAGKRVLVVHPFEESIRRQYAKRTLLFPGREVLPEFELLTVKAPQTLGGVSDRFATWFDALVWLCGETDKIDFEVAIIGAGAYGFPLAAHIKRSGRKAVHLGGATQIMFGIMGNRWETDETLRSFVNEHWTRPLPEETPACAGRVEEACYW
mgnify:CR=1 FL=1